MPAIVLVLILSTGLNVANAHPHSAQEANAALLKQFTNPVIVADYSVANKLK